MTMQSFPHPVGLHWLGDRENAGETQHTTDARGCVLYFDSQSDCLQFMRWLEYQMHTDKPYQMRTPQEGNDG